MNLPTDPSISLKVRSMQERVRRTHPLLARAGIDRTCLVVAGSSPP